MYGDSASDTTNVTVNYATEIVGDSFQCTFVLIDSFSIISIAINCLPFFNSIFIFCLFPLFFLLFNLQFENLFTPICYYNTRRKKKNEIQQQKFKQSNTMSN